MQCMASASAERERPRAVALASQLRATAAGLIDTIECIQPEVWDRVRKPGEWSPGKDAEHVTDAVALHLWHVCDALGLAHPDPPQIERARLTALRSQVEILATLRSRVAHAAALIEDLTDAQLEALDRNSRPIANIIQRPLIRHLGKHHEEIEKKLRAVRH